MASSSSPWLYFLGGVLLPTIPMIIFSRKDRRKTRHVDADSDDDEDLAGVETTGPSSSWGLMHGPYKVRGHFELASIVDFDPRGLSISHSLVDFAYNSRHYYHR